MHLELWQALIAVIVALGGGGGLYKLLTVGSVINKVNTESAVRLMAEYGKQLDSHKGDIDRLTGEAEALRGQITGLLGLVGTRDQELATVRAELATERAKNVTLLARVDSLERQMNLLPKRRDDPRPPPLTAA